MSYTIYIAGPMTGIKDFNYPAFHDAEKQLRERHGDQIKIINPAKNFGGETGLPWATYIRESIKQVALADAICYLRGWPASKGARLEVEIAKALNLQIGYVEDCIK